MSLLFFTPLYNADMSSFRHKYLALNFENNILEMDGNSFEDFLTIIMKKKHGSRFTGVSVYDGDRGNDGMLLDGSKLFQCYAPREMDPYRTKSKMTDDFEQAVDEWGDHFDEWVFVHNKNEVPPHVLEAHQEIQEREIKKVSIWGKEEVKRELFGLDLEEVKEVLEIDHQIPTMGTNFGFDKIQKVVDSIDRKKTEPSSPPSEVPADKLQANQLSDAVKDILKVGFERSYQVRNFFNEFYDPQLGDEIAKAFSDEYEDLREEDYGPNQIFHELLDFAGGTDGDAEQQVAVYAVLAYFFEQCDIYEAPR